MKCVALRPFLTTLLFAVLTLLYVMGLVGSDVVVSHWYSMVKTDPWRTLFGAGWANTGVAASVCLTLGIAAVVTAFSFGRILWGLAAAGAFQGLGLCLLLAVVSRVHMNEDDMFQKFSDGFQTLPGMQAWKEANDCNFSVLNCSDEKLAACCATVAGAIEDRLSLIFDWLLGLSLLWLFCLVMIVAFAFLLCQRSTSAPYAK